MPFNPDGTYVDPANYQPPEGGGPRGDNGETWDPTGGPNGTGAWMKPGQAGHKGAPVGQGGWSDATGNPGGGGAMQGDSHDTSGASLGKVRPMGGAGAWGGYSGTMVDDGKGGARYDANQSGRGEAVGRARGLGEAAANQQAYQIDYGQADAFAGLGQQARGTQVDAIRMARDTANGRNLQSQALGQQMLQQGVQAQQAGAASTRGGSLAQAAAMRQQAGGQGAFMQQGNTQLEAQRAAEMAAGREQYMQQATGIRQGDAAGQQLNQNQGMAQMGQELGQRGLNQQGQMGYEQQAQNVNKAAADAALRAKELQAGIDSANSVRDQQRADRDLKMGAAAAAAGGAVLAKGGEMLNSEEKKKSGPLDPYSESVSNSDLRGKTNVRGLAAAALKRKGS